MFTGITYFIIKDFIQSIFILHHIINFYEHNYELMTPHEFEFITGIVYIANNPAPNTSTVSFPGSARPGVREKAILRGWGRGRRLV